MAHQQLLTTYNAIPIYLKQPEASGMTWLQWERGTIRYGVPVTTLESALHQVQIVIDVMLSLENNQ